MSKTPEIFFNGLTRQESNQGRTISRWAFLKEPNIPQFPSPILRTRTGKEI